MDQVFPPWLLPPSAAVESTTHATGIGLEIHPQEWHAVATAVPQRIAEFEAGRACARAALLRLGIESASIPSYPCRAPQWPAGFVGSITHTPGCYAAAVARQGEMLGIGIDAEKMVPLRPEVAMRVMSDAERKRLGAEALSWATIVFSAKESVYKLYRPLTRNALEFQDVEVDLDIPRGTFEARLVNSGRPSVDAHRVFRGRFHCDSALAFTAVWIRPER